MIGMTVFGGMLMLIQITEAWNIEKTFLDWFKSSQFVSKLHADHIASDSVQHMFKGTPLVMAPNDAKIDFATGPIGKIVTRFMASEQELLGEWKVGKIVEAAGDDFDEQEARLSLQKVLQCNKVTVFSFVDCPWCLLAKKQLLEEPYFLSSSDGKLEIIELEDLGWDGKRLRAAIALETGRTSMPAIFIGFEGIGGYTDGMPGLKSLHDTEKLMQMIKGIES